MTVSPVNKCGCLTDFSCLPSNLLQQQCADLSLYSQALATCISSFAGIGYYSPELHDRAADHIARNIMHVNIQVSCVHHPCFCWPPLSETYSSYQALASVVAIALERTPATVPSDLSYNAIVIHASSLLSFNVDFPTMASLTASAVIDAVCRQHPECLQHIAPLSFLLHHCPASTFQARSADSVFCC